MTLEEEQRAIARVTRIVENYGCSREDAWRFIELRDEGYSQYQAAVMAGIADPDN
jgi:hypothetical protein